MRVGDVNLDYHQFRIVIEAQRFDVLVDQGQLVRRRAVRRQRGQAQRRKQGVLDRPEERAGRFRQCWQDEFDTHAAMLIRSADAAAARSGARRINCGADGALGSGLQCSIGSGQRHPTTPCS